MIRKIVGCFSGYSHTHFGLPFVDESAGSLVLCTGQESEAVHQEQGWESCGSIKHGACTASSASARGPGQVTKAPPASELSFGRYAELLLSVQVR